jgi:hypothetical protein
MSSDASRDAFCGLDAYTGTGEGELSPEFGGCEFGPICTSVLRNHKNLTNSLLALKMVAERLGISPQSELERGAGLLDEAVQHFLSKILRADATDSFLPPLSRECRGHMDAFLSHIQGRADTHEHVWAIHSSLQNVWLCDGGIADVSLSSSLPSAGKDWKAAIEWFTRAVEDTRERDASFARSLLSSAPLTFSKIIERCTRMGLRSLRWSSDESVDITVAWNGACPWANIWGISEGKSSAGDSPPVFLGILFFSEGVHPPCVAWKEADLSDPRVCEKDKWRERAIFLAQRDLLLMESPCVCDAALKRGEVMGVAFECVCAGGLLAMSSRHDRIQNHRRSETEKREKRCPFTGTAGILHPDLYQFA